MKHIRKHYIFLYYFSPEKNLPILLILKLSIISNTFSSFCTNVRQIATVPPREKNTDSSILLLAALHTRVRVQVSRLITDDESRVQPSKQRKGGRKSNIYHRPIFTARLLHCVPFLSHPLFPISICFFCRPTA